MPDFAHWSVLTAVFANWYAMKIFLERLISVSTDSLHVIAGVVLQLLCALIARRPLSSWQPWLFVLVALMFNEAVDLWVERWPSLAMQLGESAKDFALTMLLPTVLMLAVRWSPRLAAGAFRAH
jgi:diacylglycerol kinase